MGGWGHSFMEPMVSNQGSIHMVSRPIHHSQGCAFTGPPKCVGRETVPPEGSNASGMEVTFPSIQTNMPRMVSARVQSLCHKGEPPNGVLHVPNTRPHGLGNRCNVHDLDGQGSICLSPSPDDPKDPEQNQDGTLQTPADRNQRATFSKI